MSQIFTKVYQCFAPMFSSEVPGEWVSRKRLLTVSATYGLELAQSPEHVRLSIWPLHLSLQEYYY